MEKLILKFMCKYKGTQVVKTALKKKLEDSHFPTKLKKSKPCDTGIKNSMYTNGIELRVQK